MGINVLSKLLKANQFEGKKALSRKQMRDEIMTLMLAVMRQPVIFLPGPSTFFPKTLKKEKKLLEELNQFPNEILSYEEVQKPLT